MISFILRRLVAMVAVVFCVITITFLLMRISPGSPFDAERKISPAIEKVLRQKYKLDGTLWEQYSNYMERLVRHGDLGMSTKLNAAKLRAVNSIDSAILILPENCAMVRKSMQKPAACRKALFF